MQYDLEYLDTPEEGLRLNLFTDYPSQKVDEYIGGRIFIAGMSGSGKSVTAATTMEEIDKAGIIQLIIDTENDYSSLATLRPEHFEVIGRKKNAYETGITQRHAEGIVERLLAGRSIILLLYQYGKKERVALLKAVLAHLYTRISYERPRMAITVWVDEAHQYFPQNKVSDEVLLNIGGEIAKQGRKRGLGLGIMSQRPAEVNKNLITQCELMFLHRVRYPSDIDVYADILLLNESTMHNKHYVKASVQRMRRGQCYYCFPTFDHGDNGQRLVQMRFRHSKHTSATPGVSVLRS